MTRHFIPRRIGHANLYVYDYRRSFKFYRDVIGYEQAYIQPEKRAVFLSNGNTYHDLALMEAEPGVLSELGQPGVKRGSAGLNHIAFELENERDLVNGWESAIRAGYHFEATVNHDAAHSVYIKDPDGNYVELYADVVEDWRKVRSGVVTKKKPVWVPGISNPPSAVALYPKNPDIIEIENSIFGAHSVTHVSLIVRDWKAQLEFYTEVIGLKAVASGKDNSWVLLKGSASRQWDLVLFSSEKVSEAVGLHQIGIAVHQGRKLRECGSESFSRILSWSEAVYSRKNDFREVVQLLDPCSIRLQLYINEAGSSNFDLSEIEAVEALAVL